MAYNISPELAHQRARLGALNRYRPADDPELLEAHRTVKETRLAEHIQEAIEQAPPLTAEQRDRLAALLRGGRVV